MRKIFLLLGMIFITAANAQKPLVKKSISAQAVPDYIPGKSLPTTNEFLQGSPNGIYLAFVEDPSVEITPDNYAEISIVTNIYKLEGGQWIKSTINRPLVSFCPANGQSEKSREMSYYWCGPMTVKEGIENVQSDSPEIAFKYGIYNKNNSLPSLDFKPPSILFNFITDHAEYPSFWAIGTPSLDSGLLDTTSATLYISNDRATKSDNYLFNNFGISSYFPDMENILMASPNDKNDKFVWIGGGKKVVKATTDGKLSVIDLEKIKATGTITKMRCKNNVLWVLCGNSIYKIANGNVSKFYVMSSSTPSFAVDNTYIFANDGYKIAISSGAKDYFLGNAAISDLVKPIYDKLKTVLGSCTLECNGDAVERFVQAFSPSEGNIYSIEK
jgi:hypothetical protein